MDPQTKRYKGTILQRNYRKITFLWSFSYNSFKKFHGQNIRKPQTGGVIAKMKHIM